MEESLMIVHWSEIPHNFHAEKGDFKKYNHLIVKPMYYFFEKLQSLTRNRTERVLPYTLVVVEGPKFFLQSSLCTRLCLSFGSTTQKLIDVTIGWVSWNYSKFDNFEPQPNPCTSRIWPPKLLRRYFILYGTWWWQILLKYCKKTDNPVANQVYLSAAITFLNVCGSSLYENR